MLTIIRTICSMLYETSENSNTESVKQELDYTSMLSTDDMPCDNPWLNFTNGQDNSDKKLPIYRDYELLHAISSAGNLAEKNGNSDHSAFHDAIEGIISKDRFLEIRNESIEISAASPRKQDHSNFNQSHNKVKPNILNTPTVTSSRNTSTISTQTTASVVIGKLNATTASQTTNTSSMEAAIPFDGKGSTSVNKCTNTDSSTETRDASTGTPSRQTPHLSRSEPVTCSFTVNKHYYADYYGENAKKSCSDTVLAVNPSTRPSIIPIYMQDIGEKEYDQNDDSRGVTSINRSFQHSRNRQTELANKTNDSVSCYEDCAVAKNANTSSIKITSPLRLQIHDIPSMHINNRKQCTPVSSTLDDSISFYEDCAEYSNATPTKMTSSTSTHTHDTSSLLINKRKQESSVIFPQPSVRKTKNILNSPDPSGGDMNFVNFTPNNDLNASVEYIKGEKKRISLGYSPKDCDEYNLMMAERKRREKATDKENI